MRAYLSIFRLRFILLLQYRMAAFAGICTQFFFGLVRIMVLEAFFLSGGGQYPMSYAQAVTYIWLGQALLGMMPWGGDPDVIIMIRSGNIAYELCRPLGLYKHWYSRMLAHRTAPTLLRAVPVFIITGFLMPERYSLRLPVTAGAGLAWALATLGALLLGCAISTLINITMLWTIAGEGVIRLLPTLVMIGSGMTVPLPFFPEALQSLFRFLPFAGLVDTPFRFYTGLLQPWEVWPCLANQLAWTVVLVAFGQWLIGRAMKRVVIQGG